MNKLKWWFRVVGGFYLLIGVPTVYFALFNPQALAASYGAITDELAVRVIAATNLTVGLGVVALGVMMFIAVREPGRVRFFVLTIAMLEFFQWIPYNVFALLHRTSPASAAIPLLVLHVLFGITGIAFLRQTKAE